MIIYYIFTALYGLMIGSFLNVCIYRIPKEESIVKPHSHCTNCGTRLKALDLVPLFSFLFLGGKCRYCKTRISIRYPLIELLTAGIFVSLLWKYGVSAELFATAFLMSILIAVFFIDLEHYIIPNGLVITGLAGGAVLAVYNIFYPVQALYGDRVWWNPFISVFIGSGFLLLVAVVGGKIYNTEDALGMGDVKIFAAIGIFLGWKMTVFALFTSIILGGVLSFLLILLKIKDRKDAVPLGPFIVIGTYITLLWGWDLFNLWYSSTFIN